ncbi:hypothetical protein HDU97_008471 [Phlyctochytrium planicorne]|nr:hypothetical protein HDU97_008471 [Phlyctochytrium planicorne]
MPPSSTAILNIGKPHQDLSQSHPLSKDQRQALRQRLDAFTEKFKLADGGGGENVSPIELKTLMELLVNFSGGPLSVDQAWTLYRLLLELPQEDLGMTEAHYNMLLKHFLWDYVDEPTPDRLHPDFNTFRSRRPHWPTTPIPEQLLTIINNLEQDMAFMDIKPNGETISYLILANRQNRAKLNELWSKARSKKLTLLVWAHDTLLRGLSYDLQNASSSRISESTKLVTHDSLSKEEEVVAALPSTSKLWKVFTSMETEPWIGTYESLLAAFLSFPKLDLKALNKARSKILSAQQVWRKETYGVVLNMVAEIGDEKDLNKYRRNMKAQGIRPTRQIHNAIIKFHTLRLQPTRTLSYYRDMNDKTSKLSSDHTTYKYVLESIFQMFQKMKETPDPNNVDLRVSLLSEIRRIESTVIPQLEQGDPNVGPHTLDILISCYARIGEPKKALDLFTEMERLIQVWSDRDLYGFSKEPEVVLGSSLISAMMSVYGTLDDMKGALEFCRNHVFTDANLLSHYKAAMKEWMEKSVRIPVEDGADETDPAGEVLELDAERGELEVETTKPVTSIESDQPRSVLDLEPFRPAYEDFAEEWLDISDEEEKVIEFLKKVRAEEKEKAGALGIDVPLK